MNVKKTTKVDMLLKEARIVDGEIIDENGEVVDLIAAIQKVYGEDVEFKLTLTRSTSEEIDVEVLEDEE